MAIPDKPLTYKLPRPQWHTYRPLRWYDRLWRKIVELARKATP